MRYDVKFTSQFKKDLKLAQKQNRALEKLFAVVDILASGNTLEPRFRDHEHSGTYKGTRECHVEPAWLLVYEIRNDVLVLMFLTNHGPVVKITLSIPYLVKMEMGQYEEDL